MPRLNAACRSRIGPGPPTCESNMITDSLLKPFHYRYGPRLKFTKRLMSFQISLIGCTVVRMTTRNRTRLQNQSTSYTIAVQILLTIVISKMGKTINSKQFDITIKNKRSTIRADTDSWRGWRSKQVLKCIREKAFPVNPPLPQYQDHIYEVICSENE